MAKAIREEDLRLNLIVNGDDGRKRVLDLKASVDDLTKKLNAEKEQVEKLTKAGKEETAQCKRHQKEVERLSRSLSKEKENLASQERQLKVNTMTMSELQRHIKAVNALLRETDPKTKLWQDLNKELNDSRKRFKELAGGAGLVQRAWNSAAGAVAVVTGIIHVGQRLVRGIARAVSSMSDFEQANANLATILGKNVKEIGALTNSALDLGRTTEYTASQVTLLQTELAKLGFSEGQIRAMEEPVLHFATAVGADLPEAAALAGATLRIFDLQAQDSEDVLGALAVATNKSALNFSYLQTAMSIVGPVANTFGIDVKDTTALLGSLADAGFDASSAATATRNILLNLANANGKLAKEIGKPVRTFPELIQAMKDLDAKGLDLAKTLDLTDKRSVSAFNRFLNGAESAGELREALEDVDGELERIADDRMNTLEGSTKLFKSAWEGLILSFRNSTGPLKSVVDWLTKLVNKINDALDPAGVYRRQQDDFYKQMTGMYEKGMDEGVYRAKLQKMLDAALAEEQAAEERARKKRRQKYTLEYEEAMQKRIGIAEAMERAISDAASGALDPVVTTTGGGDGDKSKKSWSLQNDRAFLEAKVELTRQYNEGEIQDQEAYNAKLLELEIATLTARLALRRESGADRLQLEQQLLDKTHQQQENARKKEEQLAKEKAQVLAEIETDAAKKARAQEDARYAEEQKKYQDNAEMLELIEKKHRQNLSKIELDAQNQAMSRMQRAHEIERAELENHWLDRIAQAKKGSAEEKELRRQMNQELGALDLQYLNALHTLLEHIVDTGEFEGIAIPEEQLDAFKKKLQEVIKQITETTSALAGEADGGLWSGTGDGELFGVRQSQWEQLFDNLSKGKLGVEDLGSAIRAMGSIAQEGFQLASQAIAMTNAKEQEELKAYQKANETKRKDLQKRLDAGLMTQAQYDAEIEKMEAEQEAREEEMALRQAEREKRMNIVQAIINTALSVTKTLAQWGWPAGAVPAAIVGAMGAAQVAMMAATPVTGREQGGAFDQDGRPVRVRRRQDGRTFPARLSPDRRGFIDRPTVLVGENGTEYVIPAEALQNPSVAPFVDAIETARRHGRLRDLRLEAVQPRLAVAGRAAGGFFDDDVAAGALGGSVSMPDGTRLSAANYQELLQLLRRMNAVFSKPIKAEVSMLGRKGIIEKTEEYNRARRGGQLNG
ncbi:MAG: phage tail tape measure protein [Bacteroidales bacterium]|nr:phage tail tape measure protein [Bacteroidales bacterium]